VDETRLVFKAEGEECGGGCGQLGECAKGFACESPKAAGALSFISALFFGGGQAGVCTRQAVLIPATEGRKLSVAGAPTNVEKDDKEAHAALETVLPSFVGKKVLMGASSVVKYVEISKQVVSGVQYSYRVIMNDQRAHRFMVLDQPWATPRYQLTFHAAMSDESD
jgi:hypothetical protein